MESNWRFNVAYFGMSVTDWRLCARSLDDPDLVLVSRWVNVLQDRRVYYVGDPNQLPTALGPWIPTAGHFPFGEPVDPD